MDIRRLLIVLFLTVVADVVCGIDCVFLAKKCSNLVGYVRYFAERHSVFLHLAGAFVAAGVVVYAKGVLSISTRSW